MADATSPSTVPLYADLNRICDHFPHDVSEFERFSELATAVLEICGANTAVCALKTLLREIAVDPWYRVPIFFFTHEKAKLQLRLVTEQLGDANLLLTQTHHSAFRLIGGGDVRVKILSSDTGCVNPHPSLRYNQKGTYLLGSTRLIAAGSAIGLHATNEAAIIELSSPPVLGYSAEVDVRTGGIVSIHCEDRIAVRRDLRQSALQSMLRSR
jgi:hypothetical protein